jgi:hypothetical protein
MLIHTAVSNYTGSATIYIPSKRGDNSAMSAEAAPAHVGREGGMVRAETVPTVTVDEYLAGAVGLRDHIAYVKIDTQGHEIAAMLGMRDLLTNPPTPDQLGGKILTLVVEDDPLLQRPQGHAPEELHRLLTEWGYVLSGPRWAAFYQNKRDLPGGWA